VTDEATVRILVHRQNIHRYKFLLETRLTDVERAFIHRRVAEEEAEVRRLSAQRRDAVPKKMPARIDEPAAADDHLTST
jgi:hypothetical protein